MTRALFLLALAGALAAPAPARAEVIELIDKTRMIGKVLHYYDGVYSIEAQGSTVKIPREKIRSISFDLPKPRPELGTAEKTFERWRKALADGDMEKMIDCYALMYQGMLAMQVGQGAEAMKAIKKEFEGAKFAVKGSSIKGETATLKVQVQKGTGSDTGEIAFVRENGEWKMLPPAQ